jgi:uncharacterized protein YlxP (DUF503 family)
MSDDAGRVHVGAMRVDLHLPGVGSLKGKRAVINRAKAALRDRLGVSVAEVGYLDTWQRSALAVGVVAGDATGVDRVLDRVVAVVERDPTVVVTGAASMVDVLDADDLDPTAGLLAHKGFIPTPPRHDEDE